MQRRQPDQQRSTWGPPRSSRAPSRTRSAARSPSSRTRLADDAQDFAFTAGGGLSAASFFARRDADGTLSNTRTFSSILPGSAYSVAEPCRPAGTDVGATCTTAAPCHGHQRGPGRDVTCTFDNTQARADHRSSRTRCPTTPRTSPSRPPGLTPASFSLDDDCRRHAVEHPDLRELVPPAATRWPGDRDRAAGT